MESIQLLQITPQQLQQLIVDGIKNELNKLKEHFQPKAPEELLTREETAQKLKINLSTLHNWTKSRTLTSYGIGGRVYYRNSEIEQAMVKLN
jgi:Helix-turn-helix domain